MTTEIDLVGEKQPFLQNTSFLNKGKVKFLQIKQYTIRQNASKNMKRDVSVSAYVHISHDTPSPCTKLYVFWVTSPSPSSCQLCTYLIEGLFLNQKKHIKTFEYRIH